LVDVIGLEAERRDRGSIGGVDLAAAEYLDIGVLGHFQVEPGNRTVADEIENLAEPESLALEPLCGRQIGGGQADMCKSHNHDQPPEPAVSRIRLA